MKTKTMFGQMVGLLAITVSIAAIAQTNTPPPPPPPAPATVECGKSADGDCTDANTGAETAGKVCKATWDAAKGKWITKKCTPHGPGQGVMYNPYCGCE